MNLRRLLLPTMIAAALAAPASAQDTHDKTAQSRDAQKAGAKAGQDHKDGQAADNGAQRDRKAEEKARKAAKAAEKPDEPEEDDR